MADEAIVVNQHVGTCAAANELVRVDAVPAGRPRLVVVLNQVELNQGLGRTGIGQIDADDVVLNDVVQDLRADVAAPRVSPDPGKAFVLF